jgi:hypothetical protein
MLAFKTAQFKSSNILSFDRIYDGKGTRNSVFGAWGLTRAPQADEAK